LNKAVPVVVLLALLAHPVSADGGSVSVETVSVTDTQNETTVTVRYDTPVTTKINTYLFGSEELQDDLVDSVGIDGEHVEFESLDTGSAEILYDGEAELNLSVPS
jgi:hypothetical protein